MDLLESEFSIMDKKKFGFHALLLTLASLLIAESALAATYSYRNSSLYSRIYPAEAASYVTVYTYPVQAHAPIYAWRTHYKENGVEGNYSYDSIGEIIAYTDENGAWSFSSDTIQYADDTCGKFQDETYAVGSPLAQKTAPFTFYIVDQIDLDFGPKPPLVEGCKRSHWGLWQWKSEHSIID